MTGKETTIEEVKAWLPAFEAEARLFSRAVANAPIGESRRVERLIGRALLAIELARILMMTATPAIAEPHADDANTVVRELDHDLRRLTELCAKARAGKPLFPVFP